MEHRRFLAQPRAHRPFAAEPMLARAGGASAVSRLIDRLYERIEGDPALRPLFGRDLSNEREAQQRFFVEWLGGEAEYSERAYLPLKHRHDLLPITSALAERWLGHFWAALQAAVADAIAAGRWVLHPELASLLAGAGAGVDPEARDDNGQTPLDWLGRAAKSVDRAAVARLLQRGAAP